MIKVWCYVSFLSTLQVGDIITTNFLRPLEVNPMVKYLIVHFGDAWWVPKALVLLAVVIMIFMASRVSKLAIVVVTMYGLVVSFNLANVIAQYLVG